MTEFDPRPTVTAPDDDPYLWLEEVDGARAVAWAEAQNARTAEAFVTAATGADQDAVAAILDRPDNIPYVIRRGAQLYNFWKDAAQPRGLWRRTTLTSYRTETPEWEILLDIDALAAAEGEDWVWQGAAVLHGAWRHAMLRLSRGGGDAVVLREFDLAEKRFVPGGFALPEAKGGVHWIDPDTLVLASTAGDGMATTSGYARTVRLWRRGQDPLTAPVIFDVPADHLATWAGVDRQSADFPLYFIDTISFFDAVIWRGGLSGATQRIDVPTDVNISWHNGWMVLRPRTDWTVAGTTHPAGALLGIGLDAFVAGSRGFATLYDPGPRRALESFQWAGDRLVIDILDDLAPDIRIATPGPSGWTEQRFPGLPRTGVVGVGQLDEYPEDSDGTLLLTTQDPLTPVTLSMTSTSLATPEILKRAPVAFNAAGLTVTRHDAIAIDGEKIPYVQVGPPRETGDAPVHLTGYGGFEISEQPYYRTAIGKLWLERGGTGVTANLRGGGEFGPAWHDAGRRENKARSHDDFAAVAADLVRRGVTRPSRIGAEGGSNGGLLITNMLTRYPERFGALFCTIPLIDMRRYSKLLAGASWIAEYGDPDLPGDWAFIQHMSAYHQAAPGKPYPPILLATTRRDDRVHPGHARKMSAKLQAMGHRAWFYELEAGGHSYGKTNRERAFFTALGYGFLRRQIGWDA